MEELPFREWVENHPLNAASLWRWRISPLTGQTVPVALAERTLFVLNKIIRTITELHSCGAALNPDLNLVDDVFVQTNLNVRLSRPPIAFENIADPRVAVVIDLFQIKTLVEYMVLPEFPRPDAITCLDDLYNDLPLNNNTRTIIELLQWEFFLKCSPLLLDWNGKNVLFRKILALCDGMNEHRLTDFERRVNMVNLTDWFGNVRSPILASSLSLDGVTVRQVYKSPAGSILFYRDILGHVCSNQKQYEFWSDRDVLHLLEDELPMVIPAWFTGIRRLHRSPNYCISLCGLPIISYLIELIAESH